MAKKQRRVEFQEQDDGQGEKDVRAQDVTPPEAEEAEADDQADEAPVATGIQADSRVHTAVPKKDPSKLETALVCLEEMGAKFQHVKWDRVPKDLGISAVDSGVVKELFERKRAGKPLHLSDGHIERLVLLHKRLKEKGRL